MLLFEFHIFISLFELLTFEFKEKTEKEIKQFVEYSSMVTFVVKEEHMQLSILLFISSQIRLCHVAPLPIVRQQLFQDSAAIPQ